jgi:hypothetical protein
MPKDKGGNSFTLDPTTQDNELNATAVDNELNATAVTRPFAVPYVFNHTGQKPLIWQSNHVT